ncbi:polysaccharide ABC transporter ATP-binding protein [Azospirillum formosense]|nr:ABC transporter ATP-binding protein [Azospirillum formosense]MBY3757572.1 ATP-binding cassette domain-containing protein [Azospirillum formosense]
MSQGIGEADGRETAIIAEDLSKRFKIYRNPSDRVRDWMDGGRNLRCDETWALRDISFRVARGQCVGIIGANGSGKSTLLKVLSGILQPTTGRVAVAGRVLALLELGAGFNPELTGRRNVLTSARLLGFPEGYAAARMAEIEAFADIGESFDDPVRTYSSGMFVRLAFSTFIHLEPDIFVVDEALSVGDGPFQQKCITAMRRFRERGTTMLLVSHDLSLMQEMCDWGLLLRDGRVEAMGAMDMVVSRYTKGGDPAHLPEAEAPRGPAKPEVEARLAAITDGGPAGGGASADGLAITGAGIVDGTGTPRLHCRIGETLTAEVAVRTDVEPARLRVALVDRFDRVISGVTRPIEPDSRLVLAHIPFRVSPGEYLVRITLESAGTGPEAVCTRDLGPVVVYWDKLWMPFYSLVGLDNGFQVQDVHGNDAGRP